MKLFNVMVHVLTETNRHAGHADILREQVDAQAEAVTGSAREADRAAHRATIEAAAQRAGSAT